MTISIVLFALAAIGGVALAYKVFRSRPLPASLAVGHGVLAVAGFVALLAAALGNSTAASPWAAIGLFAVAALGGLALASFHLRGRSLPVPLTLIHGGVAVAGFVALLVAVLG